jgi:hypothetical protein
MKNQFNHQDKYLYDNFISSFSGATINPVPQTVYNPITATDPIVSQTVCAPQRWAENFIDTVNSATGSDSIDDLFQQKLSLTHNRTQLILREILNKDAIHKENLNSLYQDLFTVEKLEHERPFPENYARDKTWMDLNKLKLNLRDQIRRELKDAIRSISFNEKDLRESLLEFKKQSNKSQLMGTMFDEDDQKEGGDNLYNITGDTYQI